MIDAKLITTAGELSGYRVTRNLGIVRGIVVRSRSIVGNIGASLQTLLGGNITLYTQLCEKAREDAHRSMVEHAHSLVLTQLLPCAMTPLRLPPALPKY